MISKIQNQTESSAYSLIELLVVITIIAVISAIGLVSYRTASKVSRDAKRTSDLQTIAQALVLYGSENQTYFSDAATYGNGQSLGHFNALIAALVASGYLNQPQFTDPKLGAVGPDCPPDAYGYYYSSDGQDFTLSAIYEHVPDNISCGINSCNQHCGVYNP